jgi:hypothetical protein
MRQQDSGNTISEANAFPRVNFAATESYMPVGVGSLVVSSSVAGQLEIYVRPFPGPGPQLSVSSGGGSQPRWRPDGKELYFIAPDDKLMAVPITVSGNSIEPGIPLPLFQTRIAATSTSGYRQQYDVARDGRFLINSVTEDAGTPPITLLLNWRSGK